MVRMTEEEARRLAEEIYGKEQMGNVLPISKKIPVDATAEIVENTPPANTANSQTGGDEMSKMTVQEIDDLRSRNRMRVRKPAFTIVPPVVVTQVAPSPVAPSATAALPNAPRPSQLLRLLHWLFVPQPVTPSTTDLVQLRRDIKEWTVLQNSIDRLKLRDRRFHRRSEAARYIFLIITAAFYVLIACAALSI